MNWLEKSDSWFLKTMLTPIPNGGRYFLLFPYRPQIAVLQTSIKMYIVILVFFISSMALKKCTKLLQIFQLPFSGTILALCNPTQGDFGIGFDPSLKTVINKRLNQHYAATYYLTSTAAQSITFNIFLAYLDLRN